MRAQLSLLLFVLGLLDTVALAQQQPVVSSPNSAGSAIYITHVTVINTDTGKEAVNQTVLISGDRISEVDDSSKVKVEAGAKVVDGTGKYLIPGLWDMHVHAVRTERIATMFPMFVANGVLGIRDMGTSMPLGDVNRLREEIAHGSRLGPRIVATGQILDGRPTPALSNFAVVTTAAEGRRAVDSLKSSGADFVKVYGWLSRDAYFAIAEEAKKQGLPFVGHVPASVTALEASDTGQKSIEHLSGIDLVCSSRESEIRSLWLKVMKAVEANAAGVEVNDSIGRKVVIEASAYYSEEKAAKVFARFTQNHNWQVPTFVAFLQDAEFNDSRVTNDPRLKYIPSSTQKDWQEYAKQHAGPTPMDKVFERHLAIVGAMHRAGIAILAGTDSAWLNPFTYAGFSLHDELALLVRAGLTPFQALQSATISPARFLGMERDLGSIQSGKFADLVLLDADPLQDIYNTTRIREVFLAGKEFNSAALHQMLKAAEVAAAGPPTSELKDSPAEGSGGRPSDAAEAVEQVLAVDEARRLAMLHRGVRALDSLLAEDVTIFWGDGTADDKPSTLALLRSGRLRYSQLNYEGTRVRLYGQTAVVTGQARIKEQIENQNFAHMARVTRIYVRQGGRWRLIVSQTTRVPPASQLRSSSTQPPSETQKATNAVAAEHRTSEATFVSAKQLLEEIRKAPEQRPSISWVDYLDTPPYTATVIRRTAPDRSDVHKDVTEVQYVIEGDGTLVTGGSLVDAMETESGELRGRGIVGGEERRVASGDLIVIPAGTPHWIRAIEGSDIVYLSVKSASEGGGLRDDAATATHSPQSANRPQPPLEMQSLAKAFEGKWRISEKYEPGEWTPNGGAGHGEEIWRRGPGGFTFMEEVHDTGPTGESFGLALSWWDKDKGFQGLWCENHNPQGCAIGRDVNGSFKWDGKQQIVDNEFQRNGKTFSWHEVFTDITPTSFVQTADIGEKGGPQKRWLTIHATRIKGDGDAVPTSAAPVLTGKMALYNSMTGLAWTCTTEVPAMGNEPAHTERSKVTFRVVPHNVLLIEVSSPQFAGRNFIGFDSKSNQYWRTEMGVFGGIMRETSADGTNFSGKSTMGESWEPVRSVLTTVQADGSSSDTEWSTRNGTEMTITNRCTR